MRNRHYFPMFVDLSDKQAIIVGGGPVAVRRTRTLLAFTRNVTVIDRKPDKELTEMGRLGQIRLIRRAPLRSDLSEAYMVIVASEDKKLNDDVFRVCKEEGIYVNVTADRERSDFFFPAVYMQEDLTMGITVNGLDSDKARKLSGAIENAMKKI